MEKEIELEQEAIVVYSGGGAVNSVNGYTGDVVLTTSDLENTSDYQTGTEVESAISTAIAGKQDTLTAGNNITISNNTISATDTTYSAGTGLTLDGTQFSVNTETIATQQDVSNEATARENADTNLQGQIDAISASSDVTDIVGTYADLQAYDTTHLKDNDIIKVLQDESQNDETTYYRWSTSTQTFTLIGEEGPYYTKSQTDTLLQAKQDNLTAGANITIASDNTISATDTTYTAGTNVSISSGNVISATDTTYSDFTGTDGTAAGTAGLVPAPATTDAGKFLKADGTWDTAGGGSSPTVVQTTGTSTTDVMSQNATTSMVYADPGAKTKIAISSSTATPGQSSTAVGVNSDAIGNFGIAIGNASHANGSRAAAFGNAASAAYDNSVAIGTNATTTVAGEVNIGAGTSGRGYNSSDYRLLSGVYDGQNAHDAATKGQLDSIAIQNAGAPTTATVGTVGQLLEDTTNGKLYICTDATNPYVWEEVGAGGGATYTAGDGIDITNDVISATNTGKAKELTTADYNYHYSGSADDGLAPWLLSPGLYYYNSNMVIYGGQTTGTTRPAGSLLIVRSEDNGRVTSLRFTGAGITITDFNSNGSVATAESSVLRNTQVVDNLTSTSAYRPLSANQGKALNGKITPSSGASAPTTSTVGELGKIYIDSSTDNAYMCTKVDGSTYTWKQITA